MRAIEITYAAAIIAVVGLAGCDQIDTGNGPVVDTAKPTNDASPTTPAAPGDRSPPVSPPVTPPVTSPAGTTPESTPSRASTTTAPGTTADTTPPPGTRPDNTAINQRDAADLNKAKTPIDQDENQADIDITAKIRKRVLEQENFSVNARNAKIITSQGMVTLRGPVNSKEEADTIGQIAKEVAGDGKVDNQLEVAAQERTQER
jgi:hypothetical protein